MLRNCLFVLVAALVLAACGSSSGTKMHPAYAINNDGLDHVYMARVEHLAAIRGVNIVWVNPPRAPKVTVTDN